MKGTGSPGQRASNGNGDGDIGVVGSLAELFNDVATLAELQGKLAGADFKESVTRATIPVAVFAVGLAVVLATVPVALLGIADLLAWALGIRAGWTMLLTALVAAAIAGAVLYLSIQEMTRSLEPLRRSREELVRNLAWIRTVVVYSGRSFPRRGL